MTYDFLGLEDPLKEKALAKIDPLHGKLKRYRPDDDLLNFLRAL